MLTQKRRINPAAPLHLGWAAAPNVWLRHKTNKAVTSPTIELATRDVFPPEVTAKAALIKREHAEFTRRIQMKFLPFVLPPRRDAATLQRGAEGRVGNRKDPPFS